jgi:hypothetical protein
LDYEFVSSHEISDDFEIKCRLKLTHPSHCTMSGYNFDVKFYLVIEGKSKTRCGGISAFAQVNKDKKSGNESMIGSKTEILVLPRIPAELGGH